MVAKSYSSSVMFTAERRCCLACFLALLAPFLAGFLEEEAAVVEEEGLNDEADGFEKEMPCASAACHERRIECCSKHT
jgi:hypothetical protein